VACLGRDVHEAFLKALISAGFTLPEKNILLSLGGERAKHRFLPAAEKLAEMGFRLFATEKTARFLRERGIRAVRLYKVHEKRRPNIRDFIRERKVEFVISVPNPERRVEFDSDYLMRRLAVDFSVPILTNLQVAELFVQSLAVKRPRDLEARHWGEYR
jgi:carbamoyl-phosphate synthase large subunit